MITRALVELALVCAALGGAAVSWLHACHTVRVAPVVDGQPFTSALVYDPQQLLLAMVFTTAAGVLAVTVFARLKRSLSRSRTV